MALFKLFRLFTVYRGKKKPDSYSIEENMTKPKKTLNAWP
jgi:hypothetical protein